MMYVPRGFGHGVLTLTDNVEALYLVSAFYAPEARARLALERPGDRHRLAHRAAGDVGQGPQLARSRSRFHGVELMRGLT